MSASITLIGSLNPEYLERFNVWLDKRGLRGSTCLLTDNKDPITVSQVTLDNVADDSLIKTELLALADETGIDHIYQSSMLDIRTAGVAVFDMDSTLIKAEVMDELAVEAGIGEQISAVTASAMRGEIDFVESFVQRLAVLEGLSSEVMDGVYHRIQHMDGISTLMTVLHHY